MHYVVYMANQAKQELVYLSHTAYGHTHIYVFV